MDEKFIFQLMQLAVEKKASDIHISVGIPPMFRINGELTSIVNIVLNKEDIDSMVELLIEDKRNSELLDTG